jgi:argonaute-like protein implicated in RNA metabolism and viral defense
MRKSRSTWDEFVASFQSMDFASPAEFADFERNIKNKLERLMNVLEIAAAIEVEGTLSGVSRALMSDYLRRILDDIIGDDYTNAKVSELLQDDSTYIFIRRFLKKNAPLSAVLPPPWYAYPQLGRWERIRDFFRK